MVASLYNQCGNNDAIMKNIIHIMKEMLIKKINVNAGKGHKNGVTILMHLT